MMAGRMRRGAMAELPAVSADDLRALVAKSPKIGARLIESAARQGLVAAQMTLARMLLVGQGVPLDHAAAYRWFREAADNGECDAFNMLGRCHEQGWGVEADKARAAECYRMAARQGHLPAQFNLAQLLLAGDPGPSQRREGLGWHLVAAKAGHAKSMNVIGRFCEEGWDMPRSTANAIGWYRKAAEGGDAWGQFNIGRLLAEEGHKEEAAQWFRKASSSSNDAFVRSIAPVLLKRPEEEFRAIGRAISERLSAAASKAQPAETEAPRRRQPRHRQTNRAWFSRRIVTNPAS